MTIKAPKVTSHQGGKSETSSQVDLGLTETEISQTLKNRIKKDVGEFLVESILDSVASQKSPVAGEGWPALGSKSKTKAYNKLKKRLNGNEQANMELEGDMLNALKFQPTDEGVEIGFFNTDEANKADGHNKLSGRTNKTPKRRFLPRQGQRWDGPIQEEIKRIALDHIGDTARFGKSTFEGIQSRTGLISKLKDVFKVDAAQAVSIVSRNEKLQDVLFDLNLLRFLDGKNKS